MPQVTGYSEATARDRISGADAAILIKIVSEASDSVARGNVISQSVAAETQYNEGSIEEITLTVSSGKDVGSEQTSEKADNREETGRDDNQLTKSTDGGEDDEALGNEEKQSSGKATGETGNSAGDTTATAGNETDNATGSKGNTTGTTSAATENTATENTATTEADYGFDVIGEDDYADIVID
jgi:beta-lactam-binding protein with PASTA domain